MSALRESPTKYIEWQIKNFYNVPKWKNYCLESPDFFLSGAIWYLSIFPNGQTEEYTSFKWVGMYLHKKGSATKYRVAYRIGIKMADGIEFRSFEDEITCRKRAFGFGTSELLKISTLNRTQNVVAFDGSLTVFCSITVLNGRFMVPGKATQTASSTATTLEAATQTPLPHTTLEAESQTPWQAATLEAASETSSSNSITGETSVQSPSLESISTLFEDLKNMYINRRYADITILVQNKKFSAHRNILVSRSPVFASMFEHEFAEKNRGKVEISDCDPDSFEQFLLFLYIGKVDGLTASKAVHLYITADKYDVKELKEECIRCMVCDVSVDSFCDVIHLAVMHSDAELLNAATDFFIGNVAAILPTTKWQNLLEDNSSLCNELLIKSWKVRNSNE